MKRVLALILAVVLLLSGCGTTAVSSTPAPDPGPVSAEDLLTQLLAVAPEGTEFTAPVSPEEAAASIVLYGIDPALVTDCAIARLGGSRVFEIAVIDMNGSTGGAAEALLDYLVQRQGDFTGYAPDQADLAAQGKLFASADTLRLVLVITEGIREVTNTLNGAGYIPVLRADDLPESVLPSLSSSPEPSITPTPTPEPSSEPSPEPTPEPSSEPEPAPSSQLPSGWYPYTPPNTDNMSIYDTSAILTAWEAGSPEGLGRRDKWVYERCAEIIGRYITDSMNDYEKELAIYQWLTRNVAYDWSHQDPSKTTPRSSYQPYGALVEGTAVCLGFATAFQLLMDMVGVECITVVGAAYKSAEDHAWNMVKLDGEWYCVDATWDLNSNPGFYRFFNVTSERMATTDHQWDYENVPMATATDGGK